jgi:hypothetical protein
MSSIFIQIASYHDFELPRTIKDAIEKSSGKFKINFGVHHCYHSKDEITLPNMTNVGYVKSLAPQNIGLGLSRSLAHSFYNGEDYYYQIDAHSRFVQNWDEKIVRDLRNYQAFGIEKPIITAYPMVYSYSNKELKLYPGGGVTEISFHENVHQFKNSRIPSQTAITNRENNIFTKSVSGGNIFTVGGFIEPNPDIAFYGEEIFIAARAFTNGFDLMVPSEETLYHLYYSDNLDPSNRRRLIWKDYPAEFNIMDDKSKNIIYNTLSQGLKGDLLLGNERTIKEYSDFTGLNFYTGEVTVDG